MASLSPAHIAALALLETLAAHVHTCDEGPRCTRAPALLKRLDVYTRVAFTTRSRKRFLRYAIDRLAEAHPEGPEVGKRILARVLPS